ncbi:MAG TPA: alanyl-tRNA editing protein [Lysobacter sp.]|jgi:misacylated tRNA(Ala) deacylase|nr:alanyl-tRNA editing protein [Lysobacter sp.]
MQRELFNEDAYLRQAQAKVLRHDGTGLVLDATLFYPLGGGQPGDTGALILEDGRRIPVVDTRRDRETRAIVQLLGEDAPLLAAGTPVVLELDWNRRHRHMRMHTALHLLSAVIKAGVTGGNLTDQSGRLDFDTGEMKLDADAITAELQRLVAEDREVRVRRIGSDELRAQPELIRTMSVSPPLDVPSVRLIEIDGADLQPCGGTHVARTGEIGAIRVSKIESKGARNRRVGLAFVEG